MAVPGSLRARSLVGILPVVVGWTPCDCPSALAQPANGHLRCTVPSRGAARPGISRRKTGLARRATVRGEARPGIPPYFLPAAEASEIPASITVHGLRHAHASWLLAGGADLEVVKERLGHSSIVTTQKAPRMRPTRPRSMHSAGSAVTARSPAARAGGDRRESTTRRVALYAIGASRSWRV